MAEAKVYLRDDPVEKKGKMKWDKYQPRQLKLTKDGVLEYWSIPEKMEDGPSSLQKSVNLVEEGLNEVKPNKNKGKTFKFGWQIQTDGRVYQYTSSSKEARNIWVKLIQDTYHSAKTAAKSDPQSTAATGKKTSRKWGSALKNFKDTTKSGGVFTAMKGLKTDAADIKKSKFREKKEKRRQANMATLDTSSIFGCYLPDEELKQEEIMEMKQQTNEVKTEDEDENNVENGNPLMRMTLNELLQSKVQTYACKLGCRASRFGGDTSFNDDLVASNEFCVLAIGKGLMRNKELKELKENDNETETEEKYLKVNKRPMYDTSDDEDGDDDAVPAPREKNAGNFREKIEFRPREYKDNNFTICCEIYCEDVAAGNTILSNRVNDKGFEFIAPRAGSRRMAIWREGMGNKLLNVGKTELFQDTWYHIAVVCERANAAKIHKNKVDNQGEDTVERTKSKDTLKGMMKGMKGVTKMSGKEMMEKVTGNTKIISDATDFSVYLNGVFDGKLSLDGCLDLDTLECRIGSNVDMAMTSCFGGKFKHFEIYDQALSEDQIYSIAHRKGMISLKEARLLSYIPQSLKVEIPTKNSIKYNGPIHENLPGHLQWQPGLESFTISGWIMCCRAVSKLGSVVVSNLSTGNNGFELICPTLGTNVIGIRCTGIGEENKNGMSLGTTEIQCNRFYHIAVSVERIITYGAAPDQTSIVVYLNGKQDGSYNFSTVLSYKGGDWSVGFNAHYKSDSRFEGNISNVRLFQRSLIEAEIATIYAADSSERRFTENEEILYCAKKQDGEGREEPSDDTTQHVTFLDEYEWYSGRYIKQNMNEGKVKIRNKSGDAVTIGMHMMIKAEDCISHFVPGTDAQHITNLGGMIHGLDFDGHPWRIYCVETAFLQHITSASCFTLLGKLLPFPKHPFELMIANQEIDNKYILNRLLNAAHELLRNINRDKSKPQKTWIYFNEYILSWNVWKDASNFELLQKVARALQHKYKQEQFALYDKLREGKWDTFEIKNFKSSEIECRQDAFDGGLKTECDIKVVATQTAALYDKMVSSHILWGRCYLLNSAFQSKMASIFVSMDKCVFDQGPQKTYERMVEKAVEYQNEGKAFPSSYQICDVLRCSVRCASLNDIDDAYYALEKTPNIEIVRVKNRFLPSFDSNETDGYRDMLVNVLFKDDQTTLAVICEVQFHLQEYVDIKHKQHKYYKIVRAMDYKSLLRNYEARKFDD